MTFHDFSWKDESQLEIYMEISMEIFTSPRVRLFISGVGPKKNPKMRQRHCSWSKDNKARTSKARSATWYQPEIPRMEPSVLTNSREWNITIFHRRLRYIFYIVVVYISIVTLVFWGVTITAQNTPQDAFRTGCDLDLFQSWNLTEVTLMETPSWMLVAWSRFVWGFLKGPIKALARIQEFGKEYCMMWIVPGLTWKITTPLTYLPWLSQSTFW